MIENSFVFHNFFTSGKLWDAKRMQPLFHEGIVMLTLLVTRHSCLSLCGLSFVHGSRDKYWTRNFRSTMQKSHVCERLQIHSYDWMAEPRHKSRTKDSSHKILHSFTKPIPKKPHTKRYTMNARDENNNNCNYSSIISHVSKWKKIPFPLQNWMELQWTRAQCTLGWFAKMLKKVSLYRWPHGDG